MARLELALAVTSTLGLHLPRCRGPLRIIRELDKETPPDGFSTPRSELGAETPPDGSSAVPRSETKGGHRLTAVPLYGEEVQSSRQAYSNALSLVFKELRARHDRLTETIS